MYSQRQNQGRRALAILPLHQSLLRPRQEIQRGCHAAAGAAKRRQRQSFPEKDIRPPKT